MLSPSTLWQGGSFLFSFLSSLFFFFPPCEAVKGPTGADGRTDGLTGGQTNCKWAGPGGEPRWQRGVGIHGVQGIAMYPYSG
ncbi:hypothetical protein C7212DRAFT_309468 [Tuber magnatum]|uniref:Secreted protein n=1 Tax=Tuber magnatum TaxID=42249 RepID=A0A317SWT8_9PEZI|nr:hypothetical protein C7212DRAFT_309468 [Tuber magnatum]